MDLKGSGGNILIKKFSLKYINNQHIYCSIFDVFHSQNSHQHVLASIPVILRVMLLDQINVQMI